MQSSVEVTKPSLSVRVSVITCNALVCNCLGFKQGPEHIDWRVESLLKSFESKLSEISDEEFKVRCVNQLVQVI